MLDEPLGVTEIAARGRSALPALANPPASIRRPCGVRPRRAGLRHAAPVSAAMRAMEAVGRPAGPIGWARARIIRRHTGNGVRPGRSRRLSHPTGAGRSARPTHQIPGGLRRRTQHDPGRAGPRLRRGNLPRNHAARHDSCSRSRSIWRGCPTSPIAGGRVPAISAYCACPAGGASRSIRGRMCRSRTQMTPEAMDASLQVIVAPARAV